MPSASARRSPRPKSTCCRPAATGPLPTHPRRASVCSPNSSSPETARFEKGRRNRCEILSGDGDRPMTDAAAIRDKRWIALILLCSAQFVVVLDASIVNVALPTIGEALDFSESGLPWVVNAYVLTFGGFLLLGGRLADLLGRRRIFMFGLVLFALASLAGGLASTSGQLIAARAVQGLGAAILSPAALSIVATTFRDGAERNKALGIWGAVAGSGGAAGVLLGGVLTEYLGWEWVLWVNVP